MLDTVVGLEGVRAVAVGGRDGLLIDGRQNDDRANLDALAAISASLVGHLESIASDLDEGAVGQTIVEFGQGLVIVHPAGDVAVMTILLGSSANLGRLRLALRKQQTTVQEAL